MYNFIILILILQLILCSVQVRAEDSSLENLEIAAISSTSVHYDEINQAYIVNLGKRKFSLPEIPILTQNELAPGADLNQAQNQFKQEYENLTSEERVIYLQNRIKFLSIAADIFHHLRFLFFTLGKGVDGLNWSGDLLKKSWNRTKGFTKDNWGKTMNLMKKSSDENQNLTELHESNINPEIESDLSVNDVESNDVRKSDLLKLSMLGLNRILVQKAKLVAEAIEFGITFGMGVSAILGYKTDKRNLTLGGLSDVLIHIGFRPGTGTYTLSIQSLNEMASKTRTKISIIPGVDVKIGFYFKDGQDHSMISGYSYYPSNSVVGISTYGDRVIAWGFASELNPFIPTDFFGIDTIGVAINLANIEGNKLYPLFFKLENKSILGQLIKVLSSMNPTDKNILNKCMNKLK